MKENYLVKVNTKASDSSEEYVRRSFLLCNVPLAHTSRESVGSFSERALCREVGRQRWHQKSMTHA